MTDNADLANRIKSGNEGENLLNNPAFKNAMLSAKASLINRFVDSDYADNDKREEVYRRLKAMDDFFEELTDIINTGTIAQRELEAQTKPN